MRGRAEHLGRAWVAEGAASVPYPGPRPFEKSDRGLFFGRQREIQQIVDLVFANSVVVFYSKSGCGKSSLLNAGVVPELLDEGFEVLPSLRVGPQHAQPIRAEGMGNIYVFNAFSSCTGYQSDVQQLGKNTVAGYLSVRARESGDIGRPAARVIIFDQFEELFLLYPDRWEDRRGFFEQVRGALEQDHCVRFVFCLREDFLGEMESYASILHGTLQGRFRLEPLRREAALAALKDPLLMRGRSFEVGVAETIVDDLIKVRHVTPDGRYIEEPGEFVEPMQVQVVCQSMWSRLPPDVTVITLADIEAFGRTNEALSRMYEKSITTVVEKTGVMERDLRLWFERSLIMPTKTRGMVYRGLMETNGIPNSVIDELENLHIIRSEFLSGSRWCELIHDALIEPVLESNRIWLSNQRQAHE